MEWVFFQASWLVEGLDDLRMFLETWQENSINTDAFKTKSVDFDFLQVISPLIFWFFLSKGEGWGGGSTMMFN